MMDEGMLEKILRTDSAEIKGPEKRSHAGINEGTDAGTDEGTNASTISDIPAGIDALTCTTGKPGRVDSKINVSYESARRFDMKAVTNTFLTAYGFEYNAGMCYDRGEDAHAIVVPGSSISLRFKAGDTAQNLIEFKYNGGKIDVTLFGYNPAEAIILFRTTQSTDPVVNWLSQTIWQKSSDRNPTHIQESTRITPGELYPALEALMQHYESKQLPPDNH